MEPAARLRWLGGLLLNIMPCVFPILSLKALSLARAGESEAEARREGLAYTAGVVLACLALGALMLALRAAGNEIGWAFQLQEPGVVAGAAGAGGGDHREFCRAVRTAVAVIHQRRQAAGAFATGLLAAFVATPCTGPFMAAAMGAALLLPAAQALLLFAALGLGIALPFLALGFVPPLRRLLPTPGPVDGNFPQGDGGADGADRAGAAVAGWRLGGVNFAIVAAIAAGGLVLALWVAGRRQSAGRRALGVFLCTLAPFALVALIGLPLAGTKPL